MCAHAIRVVAAALAFLGARVAEGLRVASMPIGLSRGSSSFLLWIGVPFAVLPKSIECDMLLLHQLVGNHCCSSKFR